MSILGKRLRSSFREGTTDVIVPSSATQIDIPASASPRKRLRRTTPKIFEDADAQQVSRKLNNSAARISKTLSSSLKSTESISCQNEILDIELPDALSVSEQDENCPPAEVAFSTPSAIRFKNAIDNIPSTPKHRVRASGGLFTPKTPRTIDTVRRDNKIYTRARQLFAQSVAPTKLIGRETERTQLKNFVDEAKDSCKGGCIYISGPPGTGKSALVHEVVQEYCTHAAVRVSVINCVSLRTAAQVYGKMLDDLSPGSNTSKITPETQLRRLFSSKSSNITYVVMLDEVDSLIDSECEILYTIFGWALQPSTALSLVGIANALDFTDRFLPRLKSKGLKPQLLPFLPYNAQQISQIISDKLRTLLPKDCAVSANFTPCVHPAAIQLCGKKIASQTGDLRKAFNLIRRSIDLVEKETAAKSPASSPSKTPFGETANTNVCVTSANSAPRSGCDFTAETAPRATIAHMARLAASIFNNGTMSRLSGLNLQQKAVLCSIINKEVRQQNRNPFVTPSKSSHKAPSVSELFTKYTALCKRDDGILQPLKDTEFRDVVASLETLGLVHESKARSTSLLTPTSSSRSGRSNDERQIVSGVAAKEMRESLTGPGSDLLRRLLEEV